MRAFSRAGFLRRFSTNAEELLKFGRYRGQSFAATFKEDPQYCEWVVRASKTQSEPGPQLVSFAAWLEENGMKVAEPSSPPAPPTDSRSETLVGYGKYKAVTYAELLAQDPQYCDWVVRSAAPDSLPAMLNLKEWLLARKK
jgi:hypothetical protein